MGRLGRECDRAKACVLQRDTPALGIERRRTRHAQSHILTRHQPSRSPKVTCAQSGLEAISLMRMTPLRRIAAFTLRKAARMFRVACSTLVAMTKSYRSGAIPCASIGAPHRTGPSSGRIGRARNAPPRAAGRIWRRPCTGTRRYGRGVARASRARPRRRRRCRRRFRGCGWRDCPASRDAPRFARRARRKRSIEEICDGVPLVQSLDERHRPLGENDSGGLLASRENIRQGRETGLRQPPARTFVGARMFTLARHSSCSAACGGVSRSGAS